LFQSAPADSTPAVALETYTLGPGDQIVVRVQDLEEFDKTPIIGIDPQGNINLPDVGRIHAAGLTTEQLEAAIAEPLKKTLVKPDVSVNLTEMRSQRVSVLGEVKTPGVYPLQGQKNFLEVLSQAGGLSPDAGNVVNITRHLERGPIPLPSAANDSSGKYSVAAIDVKGISAASSPAQNIPILADDVISVPKAETIYVIGAVKKPGAYVLGDHHSISAIPILAMAEGAERTAATENAKIMRVVPGSSDRSEIPVDLKRILAGKLPDVPLAADDILYIPTSKAKAAGYRTLEALVSGGTMLIYRVP
jgi:polysaccharide export outer membrane protein